MRSKGNKQDTLCQAALGQPSVREAPAVLAIFAVYELTMKKYGKQGIRYVHMEAGHAAENVYLQATALQAKTLAIGAFHDSKARRVLNLDRSKDPLYLMPIGRQLSLINEKWFRMRNIFYIRMIFLIFTLGLLFFFGGCSLTKSNEEKAEVFFRFGMEKIQKEQFESAIIEFKNAIQKNPKLAKAYFQMGLAYIATQQVLLGIIEMRTAVRLTPENDAFLSTYANLLLKHRYYKDAAKYLQKMAEKKPEDLDLLLKLGHTQLKAKRFEQAAGTFKQVIQKKPASVRARIGLADALYKQNLREDAGKVLTQNASMAQDNVEAQIALARFFEKRGQYETALELFQQISRRFPDVPESKLALVQYLLRRKQYGNARKTLENGNKNNLNHPTLFHIRAYLEDMDGRKEAALKVLKKAIQLFPEDQKSWVFLGDQYLRTKQYAKARQIYRQALSKWPEMLDLKLDIANAYYRQGRYEKATLEVENVFKEHPDNPRAHYLYGKLLRKDGKRKKAKEEFRIAKKYDSDNSRAFYYYGLSLFEEKQYEKAKMEITTTLALNPESIRARMLLAEIYYHINDNERSLNSVNKVLKVLPKDIDARRLRGKIYADMKKYDAAINDYQYVTTFEKTNAHLWFKLAELYQSNGQMNRALETFKAVSLMDSDKSKPLYKMAQIHMAMKQCEKAIGICNRFQRENSGNLKIALVKAQVLAKCGKEGQAKELLKQLAETHSDSAQPYLILGDLAFYHEKDSSEAIQYYQKAIERDPYDVSAYLGQANAYEATGQNILTEKSYENALKIDPDNLTALKNLAFLYARGNRNLGKALALAKKAEKLTPGDAEVLDTVGFIHLMKGSFLLAKKYLEEASKKAPTNGNISFHLGMYAYTKKDFEAAREHFNRALASGVDNTTSEAILPYKKRIKTITKNIKAAKHYSEKGEFEKAMALYEKILDDIGFYAPVAAELASLYAESGLKPERSLKLAEKARTKLPTDAHLLDTLGVIYFNKGSFLLAKRYFVGATRISPDVALFHYHLGHLYYKQNELSLAEHALRDSIRLGLSGKALISAKKMMEKS